MYDRIYGVYDYKAESVVGPLLLFGADAAACRMFIDVVNAPGSQVSAHPGDFALVCFGTMVRLQSGRLVVEPSSESAIDNPVLTGAAIVASRDRAGESPELDFENSIV